MHSEERLTTLLLHLDPDSDPVRGRVEALGKEVEFAGWLGLASALERALEDGRREAPDEQGRGRPVAPE